MATINGARIMGMPDRGLEVCARADLVVVAASSVHEAYRAQPPRLAVVHDGRVVPGTVASWRPAAGPRPLPVGGVATP
jgi:cytosine/adenosine deaminase-related metal-dependent hydrolase